MGLHIHMYIYIYMYCSLNSVKGLYKGFYRGLRTLGLTKWDTRILDYSSYGPPALHGRPLIFSAIKSRAGLCISVPTMPPMHSPLWTPTRQLRMHPDSEGLG